MEPMTMSIMAILALFFIIVALVAFRMLTKETNFEDAYGENAMRLFAEEKSSKQKASNKNKNKTKGNDKKKMDNADKEHKHKEHHNKHHEAKKTEEPLIAESVKPAEAMVVESVDKVTEPVVSVSTIETKQGKKKNKAKHHTEEPKVEAAPVEKQVKVTLQESESSQKTKSPVTKKEKVVEKVLEKVVEKVSEKASPKEAEPVEAPEKKGKKKRARRAEEPVKDQPCESVKEEVQPLKSEPKLEEVPPPKQVKELKEQPKQTDKPKPKKVIRDITADKLHTRLSAIADLESEYLSFLATYLSDTGAQKTKQTDEIAALRKQISDKERLVLQCTDKLTAAQKKDSDIARLQQSLNDEKNKYTLFEQSVHTQLASGLKDKTYLQHINEQLKTETNAMKEELIKAQNAIKSVPPPVDTTAFQQQIDMMRAELNSSAKKASQLESELNQRTHALKQMQSEIQNREMQMKQTEVMNESHFKDVESRSKMEREFLESKVKETLKTLEEVQALAESKRDEAQKQQAIAVQTAIQHCNNEFSQQMDTLQRKLVSVEKERDAVKQEQGAKSRDEVSKLNGELEKLKDALELEQSMRSTELNKKSDEMTELRKHLDSDLGQLSELNEKLIKAEKAESEQSNKAATLEKELSQMKAQLDAEKSAKEQELKCTQCAAARIVVNGGDGDGHDVLLHAEGGHEHAAGGQRETPHIVLKCDAGDTDGDVHGGDEEGLMREVTEEELGSQKTEEIVEQDHQQVMEKKEDLSAESVELKDGVMSSSAEDALAWQSSVTGNVKQHGLQIATEPVLNVELKWPVADWAATDAPSDVKVAGSFWGWGEPKVMERTAEGFSTRVEVQLGDGGKASPSPSPPRESRSRSDSGRGSPASSGAGTGYHGVGGHMAAHWNISHEFKFVVDGVWCCAHNYEKKSSADGAFENNVMHF